MESYKTKPNKEFQVSKENLQELRDKFQIYLNNLDDKTCESLIATYESSKSGKIAKIFGYFSITSFLAALIAIFLFEWATMFILLIVGSFSYLAEIIIKRKLADQQIRHLRNKWIHRQLVTETLLSGLIWKSIIEELREKNTLIADVLDVGKVKPSKVFNDILFLSGDKKYNDTKVFKQLREPGMLDSLSEIIKDVTGEKFEIVFL